MKKVIECKISLMEKEKDFSVDKDGRGNYIIRSSGTFLPEEYIEQNPSIKKAHDDEESYMDYISQAAGIIAENLQDENPDIVADSIGIWITFDDEKRVESSMDLSTLETIKEYHKGLDPYFEFTKMTLQPFYESEISE